MLQVVLGKFMEVKRLREQLKREKEEFIKDRNNLTKDIEDKFIEKVVAV